MSRCLKYLKLSACDFIVACLPEKIIKNILSELVSFKAFSRRLLGFQTKIPVKALLLESFKTCLKVHILYIEINALIVLAAMMLDQFLAQCQLLNAEY